MPSRSLRVSLVALLIAAQVALLAALLLSDRSDLHDAELGIVAPGLVGELVSQQVSRDGVIVVPLDRLDAERGVREGELVGALVVDLAAGRDVLLVHGGRLDGVASAAQAQVAATEQTLGRRVTVRDIAAAEEIGRDRDADRTALAALILGFLLGAGTVLREKHHTTGHRLRDASLALLIGSPLIGLALAAFALAAFAPGGPIAGHALLLALIALAASLLPAACAAAASRTGMLVASTIGLCLAAPLVVHVDNLLLPQPWAAFFGWTVPGAARSAISSLAVGDLSWRAVAVIAAWAVAGTAAAVSAVRRSARQLPDRLPLLHTLAAAAPGVALLLAAAAFVPAGAGVRLDEDGLATTSECVEVGRAKDVRDLNAITRKVRGGGDVGASVELQDGRALLMFGDTVREDFREGALVRNSMLIFDNQCIRGVLPPGKGAIISNRSDGVGYWPMSVGSAAYDGYDLVAVLAQRVRATGAGGFDFEALGSSVAIFVVPIGGVPQLVGVHDLDKDSTDPTRPMWGAASAVSDGWVYLYGTATTGEDLVFGHSLRVARMRIADVVDPRAWTYWDGSAWSKDPSAAVELIAADGGTSQTLSVFEQDGQWFALSKRDEFLGDQVVVWPSPSPTGPFGDPISVADLPSDVAAGVLRYMPLAHPGLLPKPGTIVVSYSNNRTDFDDVLADPSRYRPTFLRVRLP